MIFNCLPFTRVRHVKCDEEKPACHACRKTGRLCDGYSAKGNQRQADVPSLLFGKIYGISAAALASFHLSFLTSGQERHHFDYFQCITRPQIEFAFGSASRVHQLILQASHSNAGLKHMVIALGSLTEHLNHSKSSSLGMGRKDGYLEFADTQYIKGISQLQKEMKSLDIPSAGLVLASCMLLSLFDFLRGRDSEGRIHMAAGIDILRNCFPSEVNPLLHRPTPETWQPSFISEEFAVIFSVMDLHSAVWLGRPIFHSSPLIEKPASYVTPPHQYLECQRNLDDISESLDFQVMRAHYFHHTNASIYHAPLQLPVHIYAEKERLLYELEQWFAFMDHYITHSTPLTKDENFRLALLKMNYHSLQVTISHFFQSPSSAAPCPSMASLTYHTSRIVTESRHVLEADIDDPSRHRLLSAIAANCREPDPANISILAFVAGAIQPLYLAATHSPDEQVRQKAVDLLENRPWREGAWDSAAMARLAKKGGQLRDGGYE